jgi:hypothetical protein
MAKSANQNTDQQAPTSTLSVVSLIAGLLGLTTFPFIASIAAIVTGGMAKKEIARSEGQLRGEGLATAGQILGWLGIGVAFLVACFLCFGLSLVLAIGWQALDVNTLFGGGLPGY